jgi:hypothetical protein
VNRSDVLVSRTRINLILQNQKVGQRGLQKGGKISSWTGGNIDKCIPMFGKFEKRPVKRGRKLKKKQRDKEEKKIMGSG